MSANSSPPSASFCTIPANSDLKPATSVDEDAFPTNEDMDDIDFDMQIQSITDALATEPQHEHSWSDEVTKASITELLDTLPLLPLQTSTVPLKVKSRPIKTVRSPMTWTQKEISKHLQLEGDELRLIQLYVKNIVKEDEIKQHP